MINSNACQEVRRHSRSPVACVLICGASLSGAFVTGDCAHAGPIIQPVSATTTMGSFSSQYLPQFAIDQSGLASTYSSGVTDFDTFAATTGTVNGGSSFNTWYSSAGVLTGNFDFFLGSEMTIESFALWNDPQSAGQAVNSFRLWADDNAAFSSPELLGNYAALGGLPNAVNFGQIFTFAPTSASYVRMEILSNHGSTFVTGFVEAAFEAVIPGPSALSLFAAVALVGRRRRPAR